MIEIIGVRFKSAGKIYYFDPDGNQVEKGGEVIVETARGVEYGYVELGNKTVTENEVLQPLKKVLRIATEDDRKQEAANREREKEALDICLEKIIKHKLDMKLIDVELTFDLNKIIFYFTADGRVDFRELVKELAGIFRMRIELRQIGVRDEAKLMNGIGICGRTLCCATFLDEFHPVSIKMAKEQNLSLNPTKISGICGRLMCCLKYEEDTYEYLNKNLPREGSTVQTPDGLGEVLSVSVLRQLVRVAVRKKPQDAPSISMYSLEELNAPTKKAAPDFADEEFAEPILRSDTASKPFTAQARPERPRKERTERTQNDNPERAHEKRADRPRQDKPGDKPERRNDRRPERKPAQNEARRTDATGEPKREQSPEGAHSRPRRGGRNRHRPGGDKPKEASTNEG